MTVIPWTDEETNRLFELVKAGMTFSAIAREFPGRNRKACLGRYHRVLIKRGHIPNFRKRVLDDETPELMRNTAPKRAYRAKIPAPAVPKANVGFLLPAILPKPRKGPAIGILDVTGCRWALAEDASLAGGHAFCNAPQKDGRPYCAEHCEKARSTTPIKTRVKVAA